MRILHLSSARIAGDPERHLMRLSRGTAERGHDVFIALRPTSEWQDEAGFLPPENLLRVSVRNAFGMLSVRRISRFVDELEIDIIHAHSGKDYLAASIVRRSARRARLVLTRHVEQPLKPFHKLALRNVDAAIAVSPSIREQLALTFPGERIFTVPYGIDLHDAAQAADGRGFRKFHNIPADAPLVVAADELKVGSGQRDLVLAANEVCKTVPDCFFVIAGSDRSADKKFRRELKRLAKVLGIDDRFLWLEMAEAPADLIAAADVVVSASHIGKLTATTLRAAAAGRAVITTSTDGIFDARSAVGPMDPLALAERMILFLTDDDVRHSAAARGQAAVRETFSLSRMIDETEKVYTEVLKR